MNTYEAIMRAATHIEKNPHLFNFDVVDVPACGSPGCALGWIGHFSDKHFWQDSIPLDVCTVAHRVLGISEYEFYEAMDAVNAGNSDWIKSPTLCARAMKLFANRYRDSGFKLWLADLMRKVEGETIPA